MAQDGCDVVGITESVPVYRDRQDAVDVMAVRLGSAEFGGERAVGVRGENVVALLVREPAAGE